MIWDTRFSLEKFVDWSNSSACSEQEQQVEEERSVQYHIFCRICRKSATLNQISLGSPLMHGVA